MKKISLQFVRNYLSENSQYAQNEELDTLNEVIAEIDAELNKGAAKAEANRNLYASVHDLIINALSPDTPVTIAELYEEIADRLPEGFTKSKVQHAITRMWTDEVVKHEGKVNAYTRKV